MATGKTELIEILLGFRKPTQGTIRIQRLSVESANPARVRALDVALIPQDRRRKVSPSPCLLKRICFSILSASPPSPGLFLTPGLTRQFAVTQIEHFGIRTSSPAEPVSSLSGGNQQRVVIARELATAPSDYYCREPHTRPRHWCNRLRTPHAH